MNPSKYKFLALAILPVSLVMASPVLGDAVCNDGWYSSSSGSGTCSWHGGVAYWVDDIPTWEPPYMPPWEPPVYLDDTVPPVDLDDIVEQVYGTTTTPITPPGINPLTGKPYGANTSQETNTESWWAWVPHFSPLAFCIAIAIFMLAIASKK